MVQFKQSSSKYLSCIFVRSFSTPGENHPPGPGIQPGNILSHLFTSGFRNQYAQSLGNLGRTTLLVGCLLWGSAEALVYWRKMRRRLRLGLADPVVTNRFFLWGLGAGAAGLGTAIGMVAQLVTGLPPLQMPWITLSSSLHGLTAAVALWLAFVPNQAYLRFIEARARP